MKPQYIYHLVGFDHDKIAAEIAYKEIEENGTFRNNAGVWSIQETAQRKRAFREKYQFDHFKSPNLIGSFTNLEKAIRIISEHPSGVCDQRYQVVLIEKHMIDSLYSACFGDNDFEHWYELVDDKDENGLYKEIRYVEIARPDYFKGVACFA